MKKAMLTVLTKNHTDFIAISNRVQDCIERMRIQDGIGTLYVPHTTAGVFINEGYDPDVKHDVEMMLDQIIPWQAGYRHSEGNSAAHIKAILTGNSQQIIIEKGKLVLGRWEEIFFAEFDGPRTRTLTVAVIEA